jgi:acetyltransferase
MKLALMGRAEVIAEREALVELLADAVESGASVGFLPPMDARLAQEYWASVAEAVDGEGRKILGLWEDGALAGTVQLARAGMPNGRHRAEVMKLMVHRRFRGRGYGRLLMAAIEEEARRDALRLLLLNTSQGGFPEEMYRRLGWQDCGVVPRFALAGDGELHATVFFYKDIG